MASAWGNAWSSAWGSSWGSIGATTPPEAPTTQGFIGPDRDRIRRAADDWRKAKRVKKRKRMLVTLLLLSEM